MIPSLQGSGEFSKGDLGIKLRELRARDRNISTIIDSTQSINNTVTESVRTRQNSSRRGGFLERTSGAGNMTERYKDQGGIPIEGDNPLRSLNLHMQGVRQSQEFKT